MQLRFLVLFLILFLNFTFLLEAQIQGVILDSLTKEPISFVAVIHPIQKKQAFSDLEGKFKIQAEEKDTLWFKMPGYIQQKIAIQNNQTIYLQAITLNEVKISAKDNPAYRHIRLAQNYREANNPENYPSFFYRSYTKILAYPEARANAKLDSIFENMYMIFWEVISERNFQKPRSQEKVISERISGIPKVALPISPADFQDMSFYNNYVKVLGNERSSPIGSACFSEYDYEMSDTSWSGEDTIFSIRFFPKTKNTPAWNGYIRLQTPYYTIVSIDAQNDHIAINQLKNIRFRQLYERKDEKRWFPIEYQTDFQMSGRNALPIWFEIKTQIYDLQLDTILKIKGVQNMVMEDATDTLKLAQLRPVALSDKAIHTFQSLDSIGAKIPMIRLLRDLPSLLDGYLPTKYLDWDLRRFINYNQVEKFRIGAGVRTSRNISKTWHLGAWGGYAFGDKTAKYGANFSLTPLKNKDFEWYSFYFYDLNAIGQSIAPLQQLLWKPEYANFQTQWLFQTKLVYRTQTQTQIKIPVRNWLILQLGVNQIEVKRTLEKWKYESLFSLIRLSPGEKRVNMSGKSLLMEASVYPIFLFHITAGKFQDKIYQQYQVQIKHTIDFHRFGKFSYRLLAGKNIGNLPPDQLFVYPALHANSGISFDGSFQTMGLQKYYAETYACAFTQYQFKNQRFPSKKYNPDLALHYQMAWNTKERPYMQSFDLHGFNQPFHEVGVTITNIFPPEVTRISPALQLIGVGFFSRLGAHYTNRFSEDFGFKITSLLY